MSPDVTDEELADRICSDDRRGEAEGELAGRYRQRVTAVAGGVVGRGRAEDAAQITWLKVLGALRRCMFDRGKGRLAAWLLTIVANEARSVRRADTRRTRRERPAPQDLSDRGGPADGPLGDVLAAERARAVRECLAALPDDVRTVYLLRIYEGLSNRTIGDRLGIPKGTIDGRAARGNTLMKQCLKARLGIEG